MALSTVSGLPSGLQAVLLNNDADPKKIRANGTLRHEEWEQIDDTLLQEAQKRMILSAELIGRGLTYNLDDGLATTVLHSENASDMNDAEMHMNVEVDAENDRMVFGDDYLPIPIIHKEFQLSARALAASRKRGSSLDTAQVAMATQKCAQYLENIIIAGTSDFTFGGGTIYGIEDAPNKNTVSIGSNWDSTDSSGRGNDILQDVINMKKSSISAKHYGSWVLIIPTVYETILDDDYAKEADAGGVTIRDRILKIKGIEDIIVSDYASDDTVSLVELDQSVIRLVTGMDWQVVEWTNGAGTTTYYSVMGIYVPQLRSTKAGNSGVVVLS